MQKGASQGHCWVHYKICKISHLQAQHLLNAFNKHGLWVLLAEGQNRVRQGRFFRGSDKKGVLVSEGREGTPRPSPDFACLLSCKWVPVCGREQQPCPLHTSHHPLPWPGTDRWQDRHVRASTAGNMMDTGHLSITGSLISLLSEAMEKNRKQNLKQQQKQKPHCFSSSSL